MNRKECPLKAMAPCWKEKCAWYLVKSKQCAIPLMASKLTDQKDFLNGIHRQIGYLKQLDEEMEK